MGVLASGGPAEGGGTVTMASPQHTPEPALRLVQDEDPRTNARFEQLPLPGQRLFLVAPISFPGRAVLPVLVVLFGGEVQRRRRKCAARGPWACCLRHRREHRGAHGCRDCRADLLSWRPRAAEAPGSRPEEYAERPRTWGDCQRMGLGLPDNPCPFVSCRKHLALTPGDKIYRLPDGRRWQSIKIHFRDKDGGVDIDRMKHTCAQRFADQEMRQAESPPPGNQEIATGSGHSVEEIAEAWNMSEEWVRQTLRKAIASLKMELVLSHDAPVTSL